MPLGLGAVDLALTTTGAHVVERLMGEQSVVGDRLDRQVDAVVGDVGRAAVDQLADHRDHLVDVVGGVRGVGRTLEVDRVHPLPPHRLAASGDVLPGPVLAQGTLDDLVLDVGDVRHEAHLEPRPLEVPAQDVVLERRPAVAEVRRTVHRGPAQVDADLPGLAQGELPDLTGGGVVQAQHAAEPTVVGCAGRPGLPRAGVVPWRGTGVLRWRDADPPPCQPGRLRPRRPVSGRPTSRRLHRRDVLRPGVPDRQRGARDARLHGAPSRARRSACRPRGWGALHRASCSRSS